MAISEADKIRNAEEIYYRRNGIKIERTEKSKSKFGSFIKKIFLLVILIGGVYAYQNRAYFQSEVFQKDMKKILNTKININELWNQKTNKEETKIVNSEAQNQIIPEKVNEVKPISYKYIMPLNGIITSPFGKRESENSNVAGNHTGIDIAGKIGDKIRSSTYGKVIEVSDQGSYGNHLKIENEGIITLYAHCNCIYVATGDIVTQGQEIAEVGSTGNSTGPHLHFEIREDNIPVNPLDYIEKV